MATSTAAAAIARSRTERITSTTRITTGGITFESREEAARRSRSSAVGPPTSTSRPPAALVRARSRGIASNPAWP